MSYFPFFADLEGKKGLIIGGGTVALRKIEKLLPYGPELTVAAPEILPSIAALPGLTLCRREFQAADLTGMSFVIAAASDREANRRAAVLCKARNIPVNAADDPEACTFYFPALVKRGPLTIGISTGGASPAAAAYLREQIAAALPDHLEEILEYLARIRPAVKGRPDAGAVFRRLLAACLEHGRGLTEEEFREVLERGEQES